ncbi:hypothetical protein L195_g054108, partial [Trifolium pratense]
GGFDPVATVEVSAPLTTTEHVTRSSKKPLIGSSSGAFVLVPRKPRTPTVEVSPPLTTTTEGSGASVLVPQKPRTGTVITTKLKKKKLAAAAAAKKLDAVKKNNKELDDDVAAAAAKRNQKQKQSMKKSTVKTKNNQDDEIEVACAVKKLNVKGAGKLLEDIRQILYVRDRNLLTTVQQYTDDAMDKIKKLLR